MQERRVRRMGAYERDNDGGSRVGLVVVGVGYVKES